jgi:hypothetical protein
VRAYLSTRKGVVQAAVFDKRTGRTYVLSTGRATQYTASVVKVDILAMWLPCAHPVQHADPDPAHRRRLPDAELLRLGQYDHHGRRPGGNRPHGR